MASSKRPRKSAGKARDTGHSEAQARLARDMMRSIVTEPLLTRVRESKDPQIHFDVIVVLNELYKDGMSAALIEVEKRAREWNVKYSTSSNYCFATLTKAQILQLAEESRNQIIKSGPPAQVVYRIWEDTEVFVSLLKSVCTVKADAAQRSFQAFGDGIVWAVLDSGIHKVHPHFKSADSPFGPLDTLRLDAPLEHKDFTELQNGALVDDFGHGTHVAGIIAGYWQSSLPDGEEVIGTEIQTESAQDGPERARRRLRTICGVAPKCRLVSLKVIADQTVSGPTRQTAGQGKVSWILKAIDQIQEWNNHGKRLLIHGVNMSLGYDFDPRWFGCGQSPLCVEVDRLVKSGVSVVVAAGNGGYSSIITAQGNPEPRYNNLSISDPGNAELAITVGSTHRDMPHRYGVSYFSSRGPTGDGRLKPDLVAPGERIVSCAAGLELSKYASVAGSTGDNPPLLYCEQTGTSMAAPHVSGAVAAFLSVRQEFIGLPEQVKRIMISSAIDLRRERQFQGAGLIDLMKALQAV